jgi:MinD-like ATPase involved in chromosome partitioning or flagellar assembly
VNTSVITLHHPEGRLRLSVPTDIPIDELMPDFLDVTQQRDGDGWLLGPADGGPYPPEKTLADLGVGEGTVLVLHEPVRPAPSGREQHASPRHAAARTSSRAGPGVREASRARERTARALPERLTTPARVRTAACALFSAAPREQPGARASSGQYPATFMLPARVSPLARARQAWWSTDYQARLERMVQVPRLRRCVTIAVVSPKGGVGKSTTTALLGSLLAFLRRDRVVAVDTNNDWGSLGRRLVPDHPVFIDDLLAGPLASGQLPPTELDAQLGRGPNGLMVAPAPTDPERAEQLDETAYRTLFTRLGELVGMLVLDCGTGLGDPPARAALSCADQLVLVADCEPDTASLVSEAAAWLEHIAPPLVLVVNKLERSSRLDVDALEREIEFARGLVTVPTDQAGAHQLQASHFSWSRAPTGWRHPVRELAALITADWRRLGIAH